jgi:hypothetical protein
MVTPIAKMPPNLSQRGIHDWWQSDARQRIDAAVATLAQRWGVPAVDREQRSRQDAAILAGDLESVASVSDAVVALTRDIDELRAEVDALKGVRS